MPCILILNSEAKYNSRVEPRVVNANKGGWAEFSCDSLKDTKWYFLESGTLRDAVQFSDKRSITIYPISKQKAGYYYCFGFDESTNLYFVASGELNVYG